MATGGSTEGSSIGGGSIGLKRVRKASTRVTPDSAPMYVRLSGHNGGGVAASGMVASVTRQETGLAESGGPLETAPALADGKTTLMVRNLPRKVSLKDLVEEMERAGFAGLFDLVYRPTFTRSGACKGFAFVNFTSHWMAKSFAKEWGRSQRFGMRGKSAISIAAAVVQGFDVTLASLGVGEDYMAFTKMDNPQLLVLRAVRRDDTTRSSGQPPGDAPSGSPLGDARLNPQGEALTAPSASAVPMPRFLGGAPASSSRQPHVRGSS